MRSFCPSMAINCSAVGPPSGMVTGTGSGSGSGSGSSPFFSCSIRSLASVRLKSYRQLRLGMARAGHRLWLGLWVHAALQVLDQVAGVGAAKAVPPVAAGDASSGAGCLSAGDGGFAAPALDELRLLLGDRCHRGYPPLTGCLAL